MRKLFVQFYLLLFVSFVLMTLLVGLVYKVTAERAGRESMDDLMKSSLYLIRSELREIPPKDWNKTLSKLDWNLSFKLHIEPLGKRELSPIQMAKLHKGEIVALDNEYSFIQRIPRSNYVLAVGPIPYLFFLHEMRLLNLALLLFIALSLALPVFIWMRPHWKDLLKLESAAQRLGAGYLEERTHFDNTSSLHRLGLAFNQMADNISAVIASKKQLIDGIAHELRTPLVRLHYRLAMSENLASTEQAAFNRDIGQLEALIDELLTYARLNRPQRDLHWEDIDLCTWLQEKVSDIRLLHPQQEIQLKCSGVRKHITVDIKLIERVLDNLVNNALCYSKHQLIIRLQLKDEQVCLQVEDDGPGIPPEEHERIFEPFVRLDPSRDRATGGCGLGLAIVYNIAQAFQGHVSVVTSSLGGACLRFCWPTTALSAEGKMPTDGKH